MAVLAESLGRNGHLFLRRLLHARQTGAGKTHTMMGPANDPGLIPRGINKIFDLVQQRSDTMFVLQCSYVELYMDTFIDLLDPATTPRKRNDRNASGRPKTTAKIEIHEDAKTKQVSERASVCLLVHS
jgi:hypothetical protein